MNEKAFVFPLTLIFISLLILAIAFQANSLIQEKRFIAEQERVIQLQSLLQMAIVDFQKNPDILSESKVFSYEHGTVTLIVTQKSNPYVYEIQFQAELIQGNTKVGIMIYHDDTRLVEEYWEVK
ncbi:competence type IV pilus minor pilin ComGG [Alkalihalobacillus sp. 1P02AB]|uniref:competence type IV pilus minor pilin ComGG n=1 Tax=Alkalihalobacillus sp. 1P02AB TaxID=3132260 RepID=UPI0039A5DB2E